MGEVILTLKENIPGRIKTDDREIGQIPVEAENITPDNFKGKSQSEIGNIKVNCGDLVLPLQDFFKIEGEDGTNIVIRGDVSFVKRIGQEMSCGSIHIQGNVGLHTGMSMSGGTIIIDGDADDWLGTEMTGGLIRVKGDAGSYIGAPQRANKLGMNRGVIIVEGDAGDFVGEKMRRGEIIILGDVGDFVGSQMIAGSIYLFGQAGIRVGAGMKRGTIIAFSAVDLMPTFKYNITYRPGFIDIAFDLLEERFGIKIDEDYRDGKFKRFSGDISEIGKGEILIWEE